LVGFLSRNESVSLLRIDKIARNFGGLRALDNVSFELQPGEILAVIGPNGAGKTTLFNIITGFIRPDNGSVLFQNQSLLGLKPHRICQRGLVRTFQIVKPFLELSVLENVIVAAFNRLSDPKEAAQKAEEVIAFVGLADKRRALANELNLPNRKRLELARALATGPTLLMLDEVMAGINPTETDNLIGLIREIHRRGTTILLIEHVMRGVMALSQRILVLNFGEKIAEGVPEEVMKNPLVVEAYLGEEYCVAPR
jgi:branched-chain amino acid transport system ATP-binding protein